MHLASDLWGARVTRRARERSSLVVLISGSGTNLQALIDATGDRFSPSMASADHQHLTIDASILGVVSNRRDAYGLVRAKQAGIATRVVSARMGEAREDHDRRLRHAVDGFKPDWVVLAGYMRILSMEFLGAYPGKVINLHPALPGDIPGTDAISRAFAEWQVGTRTHSGAMVHLVPDEGVDAGPILGQVRVPFAHGDILETFANRMHSAERLLLVSVVAKLCDLPSVNDEREVALSSR